MSRGPWTGGPASRVTGMLTLSSPDSANRVAILAMYRDKDRCDARERTDDRHDRTAQ